MGSAYLTDSQIQRVQGLIGHAVIGIEEYHWQLEDEQPSLEYVKLEFADGSSIIVRVGALAENVDLIDPDELENELERRGREMFVKSRIQDSPVWKRLLGHVLLNVTLEDVKGYAHSSIVLHSSEGATQITTTADALEVRLPPLTRMFAGSDL